jgi:hypothetical protein
LMSEEGGIHPGQARQWHGHTQEVRGRDRSQGP